MNAESAFLGHPFSFWVEVKNLLDSSKNIDTEKLIYRLRNQTEEVIRLRGLVANYEVLIRDLNNLRTSLGDRKD